MPIGDSWEAALILAELGFLIPLENYLVLLEVGVALFDARNWKTVQPR